MAVRFILFDIDDTLFPSTEFAELARRNSIKAMVDLGLQGDPEKLYAALLGIIGKKGSNFEGHFDELCKALRVKRPERYIAAAIAAYHNTKMSIQPFPGIPKMLLELREKGYKLYVTTNGSTIKQWDKLIRLRIAIYFEDVFVSEEMGEEKGPDFFRTVLKSLNAKPEECLVVGDREEADIAPSKAVGMRTVRVMQGKHAGGKTSADLAIKDTAGLPEALKKLIQ